MFCLQIRKTAASLAAAPSLAGANGHLEQPAAAVHAAAVPLADPRALIQAVLGCGKTEAQPRSTSPQTPGRRFKKERAAIRRRRSSGNWPKHGERSEEEQQAKQPISTTKGCSSHGNKKSCVSLECDSIRRALRVAFLLLFWKGNAAAHKQAPTADCRQRSSLISLQTGWPISWKPVTAYKTLLYNIIGYYR